MNAAAMAGVILLNVGSFMGITILAGMGCALLAPMAWRAFVGLVA